MGGNVGVGNENMPVSRFTEGSNLTSGPERFIIGRRSNLLIATTKPHSAHNSTTTYKIEHNGKELQTTGYSEQKPAFVLTAGIKLWLSDDSALNSTYVTFMFKQSQTMKHSSTRMQEQTSGTAPMQQRAGETNSQLYIDVLN